MKWTLGLLMSQGFFCGAGRGHWGASARIGVGDYRKANGRTKSGSLTLWKSRILRQDGLSRFDALKVRPHEPHDLGSQSLVALRRCALDAAVCAWGLWTVAPSGEPPASADPSGALQDASATRSPISGVRWRD